MVPVAYALKIPVAQAQIQSSERSLGPVQGTHRDRRSGTGGRSWE